MLATKEIQRLSASGKIPVGTKQVIRLPADSPIRYLPAYYFLPAGMIAKSKECADIPRNPLEALESEHWRGIIHSKAFLQLVMEGIAFLAWPHIGIYAPKESFSMDDPLYRWIYATPLHIKPLERFGYGINALFRMKRGEYYPYLSMEQANNIMDAVMQIVIHEHNMAPIIDCIKGNRCDEDFNTRKSWAKTDFLRKKLHTRDISKIKVLSVEQENENRRNEYERTGMDIPDTSAHMENEVLGNVVVDEFKRTLSHKDMEILELRMQGRTYEQIAETLGYKTHSAVIKRIKRIAETWSRFTDDAERQD